MIDVGDKLPGATLLRMGGNGPEGVDLKAGLQGKKAVIFGVPGAYTGVCTTAHVPGFIRTAGEFRKKGIDEIICVSVNDPFVMDAWSKETGATEAGITLLGDPGADFIKAIGMEFSAPPAGLIDRSKRFSMLADDGIVKVLHVEESPGVCEISAAETLLAEI